MCEASFKNLLLVKGVGEMKWLVLLAGCGLGDGSCVEEVIATYIALDKYHCDYLPIAENILVSSIDHVTELRGEKRSVLVESARLGRGRIRNIRDITLDDFDALLIPGGIGLLVNYRDSDIIKDCVKHFVNQKKAIGTMCAGIDFLRRILGVHLLEEEAAKVEATSCCSDSKSRIFYTPAFRKTQSCYDVMLGVDAMVQAMMES